MFSSIKRFASIIVAAISACASFGAVCVSQAVAYAYTRASFALDVVVGVVARAASNLPSLAPKRPTGTAAERTRLIPADAYQRTQDVRRSPTIQPGWRMCASV